MCLCSHVVVYIFYTGYGYYYKGGGVRDEVPRWAPCRSVLLWRETFLQVRRLTVVQCVPENSAFKSLIRTCFPSKNFHHSPPANKCSLIHAHKIMHAHKVYKRVYFVATTRPLPRYEKKIILRHFFFFFNAVCQIKAKLRVFLCRVAFERLRYCNCGLKAPTFYAWKKASHGLLIICIVSRS